MFAYVVLVDEINRTSPKVQSALLEAMAEKQVTVDNVSHKLNELFFVMATQNPLDAVGTYPLPLAQLDRFLFKLVMKHIDRASELEVLRTWGKPRVERELPRVPRGDVVAARSLLRENVSVTPAVHECLVDVARRLREDKRAQARRVDALPGAGDPRVADARHVARPRLRVERRRRVPRRAAVRPPPRARAGRVARSISVIRDALGVPLEVLSSAR